MLVPGHHLGFSGLSAQGLPRGKEELHLISLISVAFLSKIKCHTSQKVCILKVNSVQYLGEVSLFSRHLEMRLLEDVILFCPKTIDYIHF